MGIQRKDVHDSAPKSMISSDSFSTDDTSAFEDSGANTNNGNTEKSVTKDINSKEGNASWMSPTLSMPLLVFMDMFAVSLVVPLLFQYYKNAGVTSANQRELLSSVFSSSQIVGGIVLGALTDAKMVSRKTVLFISFGGSALGYAMIAFGNYAGIIMSRILVGLVKQTITITTSILTQCTTEENRAKHMGRLESSITAAWIVGPSTGAILFKYVDHAAPVLLACALFLCNLLIAALFLQDDIEATSMASETSTSTKEKKKQVKGQSFWTNFKSCFSSRVLGSVIASSLVFSWVNRATSYASMGSYYEDMYGVEPHHRGYIQSYQRVLAFVVQSTLIGPILSALGGERRAACIASLLLALATFWEMQGSIYIFIVVLSPFISLSTTLLTVSLRSLLTRVAPAESMFSVFAALDVLQNASAVTVPFYRTFLFHLLRHSSETSMEGDPDPVSWVFASGMHWLLAALAMAVLLRPDKSDFFGLLSSSSQTKHDKKI